MDGGCWVRQSGKPVKLPWTGNFYVHKFICDGYEWHTSEQYYQASKFPEFSPMFKRIQQHTVDLDGLDPTNEQQLDTITSRSEAFNFECMRLGQMPDQLLRYQMHEHRLKMMTIANISKFFRGCQSDLSRKFADYKRNCFYPTDKLRKHKMKDGEWTVWNPKIIQFCRDIAVSEIS